MGNFEATQSPVIHSPSPVYIELVWPARSILPLRFTMLRFMVEGHKPVKRSGGMGLAGQTNIEPAYVEPVFLVHALDRFYVCGLC